MLEWINEHPELILESVAVFFGIIYVVLIAKNRISGWVFGIISSFLSIFLFIFYAKLYSEALLYSFYVIAGFYGWYNWSRQKESAEVYYMSLKSHLIIIAIGLGLSLLLYWTMTYFFTDAEKPLVDAFTTIFSFIATFLATKKWIGNWIYWIIIDLISVWLYFSRDLEIYALLMLVYSVIAVFGYMEWKKLKVITDA
jgi:nicotinamide mononucleotide transporter